MQNKKNNLNKKGNIMHISSLAVVFSLISIIYIFFALFMFGTANDYLFYELQNMSESLEADGVVKAGTSAQTQTWLSDFTNFNLHLDTFWLIGYITFIMSSIALSYKTRKSGYFTAFGYLFYLIMFVLFMLTLFSTITNWFNVEILEKVLPTAQINVPMFYYYLAHIGVFTSVHLVVCLLVNLIDFDFSNTFNRRKQEITAVEDEERL